ncbi:MAG: methyltransferase domain-containing protein [Planctomycetota bacterium]|nr:MAG: methyltransferase domain-containing protein [Planctomycetota bacterium]
MRAPARVRRRARRPHRMIRREEKELLEDPTLPAEVVAGAYRELARTQRWLGNTGVVLRLLQDGSGPVGTVLDIGCGQGDLLQHIRRRLGVRVLGFDLRPAPTSAPIHILAGDATRDPLPRADVAIAMCVAHHLREDEVVQLIGNVARSCRRLILVDPVRHPLPLLLFRVVVAPLLRRINASDGATSIRRSFTPAEFGALVAAGIRGSRARVEHTVAPLFIRQVVDIRW